MSTVFERIAYEQCKRARQIAALEILRPCSQRVLGLHRDALENAAAPDQMPEVEISETEFLAFCIAYDHEPDMTERNGTLFGMPLRITG